MTDEQTPKERIAFVGLGQMGTPIAQHLVASGHDVMAFDLNPHATSHAASFGATAATSYAALIEHASVFITMLPDGNAVRQALEAAGGTDLSLLGGLDAPRLVIDMSSSDPAGTVELAEQLGGVGIDFVDAPVSGGVAGAKAGTLAILFGGDEQPVARSMGILDSAGAALTHVGPAGAAHAMKALNNVMSAAGLLLAAEVMLAGAKFGLDPATMLAVLNASTGRNHATETKIDRYILSQRYDSGFRAALMLKDLHTALNVGRHTGAPMPIAHHITSLWALASSSLPADADQMHLVQWLEDQVGVHLGDPPGSR